MFGWVIHGPSISHIFFVDDTLIFLKADNSNCRNLGILLDSYYSASGQAVNLQKSYVYFSANTPHVAKEELGAVLGIPVVSDPGSYLGLPALWGRSKGRGLAYVKGRLLKKIQGWQQCTLSQAGKEVMIKAVAQAIPAYPMNILKFPVSFCKELDSLIYGFWWGQKNGERKIHWVSKSVLGLPKSEGGLGFRNFMSFNDVLLAKQCWGLFSDPTSLWASILKARYFPNCSILDATRGCRASWVWNSLLVGRDLLVNEAH